MKIYTFPLTVIMYPHRNCDCVIIAEIKGIVPDFRML